MGILFQFIKYKAMTREEAKELLPIIQAFADGKHIQWRNHCKNWIDIDERDGLNTEFPLSVYRIKPEPYYRPFRSQEECVKEMMNHKPFGIVTDGVRDFEVAIYPDGIFILGTSNQFYKQSFYIALKEYKFPDSTPFGVKE